MRNWSVEKLSSLFFLILTIGSTSNVQAARFVRNEQTLTCLELTSAPSSSLSCVHVTLSTCPNNRFSVISESLKWSLTPTNSSFLTNNTEVIIKSNEFCLSASTDNNVVEACPCDNGIAQKWKLKDDSLNSVNAGKCLGLVGEEVALGNCQNWSTYHVSPNAVNLYTNAEFAGKPQQLFVNSYNKASLPVEIFSSPFSLEIPPGFEFIVDRGNNNVKKFEFDVAPMPPIESDSTVIIKLKPGMTIYEHPAYFGASKFIEAGPTTINDAIIVGSALLPEGFRGVFWQNSNSTGNNLGLFEPIVNFTAATKQNSFNSLDISSTKCKNECGSGGYCSDEGTCICKPGFTGERCEQCSDGFFGPDCQKCNCTGPNKSICDDGLAGTGECKCGKGFGGETCDKCAPGFFGNNCQECKCGNGICNEQGTCSCNAGFLLDVNNQCIKCKEGFFKSGNDCKPCAPGCESCEAETGVCSKCPQGYSYGDGTNSCIPNPAECPPTQFFDGNTCQNCNIACGSCFGPTERECLTCSSTTFYMEGICVEPSSSDGKCSTSEAFYANNTNRICEPCPGSCLDCSVQNFNVLDTTGNMQCTRCMPGFVLDDGKCVEECSEGKYADKTDSVCKACDAKCSSCKGPGENECIKCSENNFFVFNGECSTQCPSGYVAIDGVCSKCHADCLECSGSEIKQCTKCPDNRPVLVDGQCLEICPMGTYADKAGCQKCNSDCSSCTGPGSDQCLGCSDQSKVLLGGSCSGTCPTGSELIKTERLCQDLLTETILPPEGSNEEQNQAQDKSKQSKQFVWWGILLIVIGSCVFLILLIYFVRTYAVKRRKEKTRKFGEQLDENIVAQNFKKLLRDNAREPSQPEMSYGSRSRSRHDKHVSISSDDYNKWKKNSRSNEDLERFDVVIAGGSPSSNDDNVSDNYQGGNIYRNSSKNGNGYRNNIRSTGSTTSIRSKRTFTLPAEKGNSWGENWI